MIWLLIFFLWWLFGVGFCIWVHTRDEDMTVKDIFKATLIGLLGLSCPLLYLVTKYSDKVVVKQRGGKQ